MATIRHSAIIAASPDDVWAFLAHGPNWARWEPDILHVLSFEDELQVGGALRVRLKPGRMKATIRFLEVEPRMRLACRTTVSAGMMTADAVFELRPGPAAADTDFSYSLRMNGPVGAVLQAVNPDKVDRQLRTGLANIIAMTSGK